MAAKIQRPTAALRRKKLNGEASSLSNNTKTKSVEPQTCRQNIMDTNVPDTQFLIQFDTLYKRMNSKLKKDIQHIVEGMEEYYGWLTICDQKRTLIEKRVKELKDQGKP